MNRHPSSVAREQRALRQTRTRGRRHADSDTDDARDTDPYLEPYRPPRRAVCEVIVFTDAHTWQRLGRFDRARAIEIARTNRLHCRVRDAKTWAVIFDNRKG
jgi:hypothetical protein